MTELAPVRSVRALAINVSQARAYLATCRDMRKVKELRDRAKAIACYLATRTDGIEARNDALEVVLCCDRSLGKLLRETPKAKGQLRRGSKMKPREPNPTYREQGISKTQAYRWQLIASVPQRLFDKRIAEAKKKGERLTQGVVLGAARRRERTRKLVELAKGNTELDLPQRYPVIYADPPWRYEHCKTESRAIENQYPTMALDEICALPVARAATEDAILFLWATSPKLAEAMQVIESWGFTYRTSRVWVKDKIGMGYYARQRHELLLIATKGRPPAPPPEARPDSVIEAPRGKHSAKPDEAAETIERMYPELPRVELFCRSPRDGWAAWGNEA